MTLDCQLDEKWTVIFDEHCELCRSLAGFIEKHGGVLLQVRSQQAFADEHPEVSLGHQDQLMVWTGTKLLTGRDAWRVILERHPSLKALNWLAARLNLQDAVATFAQSAGHRLRQICWTCLRRRR